MDEQGDIERRSRISNLQAKLELLAIERASLLREINSPLVSRRRMERAIQRCRVLAD
jgi:hypothetical protein